MEKFETNMPSTLHDNLMMRRALEISNQARYLAPPNPWVGCLIVNQGFVVAEGYTNLPGKNHAEIEALNQAQGKAEGATVYVTLEPCPCQGRTPPCTEALIKAKVKRAVIAVKDPDPRVSGKGIEVLQKAGIQVDVGVLEDEVKESLCPYLHHRKKNRPFCLLKAAVSLDGKIATQNGSSFWITGKSARKDVHLLRAASQAVIVGAHTAFKDQPSLTVRDVDLPYFNQPLRVILDSSQIMVPYDEVFRSKRTPTLLVTGSQASDEWLHSFSEIGVEVIQLPIDASLFIDLKALLQELAKRDIIQVMVEGGSKMFSSFLRYGLVDRLILYKAACLLGDSGLPLFSDLHLEDIIDAKRLRLLKSKQFDQDIRLDYEIIKRN